MAIVVIERGDDKGKSIKLEPGADYVFGRDPDVAVPLSDKLTSRRHFSITFHGVDCVLSDLGSTNGTFLNDDQVTAPSPLKVGDKIQAGETIISFLSDQKEESRSGLVGKTIGGYKLLERVGRGGMGTVYKANQLSLNRVVALKVLSARLLEDEKFIEKFKSEARAAGQLNHPNIVQVYDVGTESSLHFFSMEFMDGQSVQDLVGRDRKLPWEQVLDVLVQTTRALIFAERKGIVHRDVKPDNLMMTSDGQVKLADLGLARQSAQTPVEEGIFGTPHFISPEQAQGRDLDHRADLYSLGATAYRLLAGRTPFEGVNVQEIIQKQITEAPPPLKQFCPDAPEELRAIVRQLMKKVPDDRFASAEDLFAALDKIRLRYHLKAHGVGGPSKALYAAVGVALVAVAGVIFFAMSRGDGNGGNGGTPIAVGTPQVGTPKVVIDDRTDWDLIARAAYQSAEARQFRLGPLEESWRRKNDWEEVAKAFDRVASDPRFAGNPKTADWVAKARDQAKKIRETIARLEQEEVDRQTAAARAWNSFKVKVDKALDDREFLKAAGLVEGISQDVRAAAEVVDGANDVLKRWTAGDPRSVTGRFNRAWADIQRSAKDLAAKGDFVEAARILREFAGTALAGQSGVEPGPPFDMLWTSVDSLIEGYREELERDLTDALASDRRLFYSAYHSIRPPPQTERGVNMVFDFRFAEAADVMQSLLSAANGLGLETAPYRLRTTRKVAQLRSMQALMDSMRKHLSDGDVLDRRLALPARLRRGGRGVEEEINWDAEPTAPLDGLEIVNLIRQGGAVGRSQAKVLWAEFFPEEMVELIFLSGARWTFTPEEFAALARLMAETGVDRGLPEIIARAGDALDAGETVRLQREYQAIIAWDRVLANRGNVPPQQWILDVTAFIKTWFDTDYFIFAYGFDAPWQRLIDEATVNLWMKEELKALDPK